MSLKRCPGSMAFAQPKIELVRCQHCGADTEVWSDEAEGKCAACGKPVCRTNTQSCVDWCKYARECLGDQEYKRYQNMKTGMRKESLLKAAEASLTDERLRALARDMVASAEKSLSREPAADPNVVIAASALFAVSRQETESRAARGAGVPPASEPSSAASGILHELGYPEGFIKEVCDILRHLGAADEVDSINFRVVRNCLTLSGRP